MLIGYMNFEKLKLRDNIAEYEKKQQENFNELVKHLMHQNNLMVWEIECLTRKVERLKAQLEAQDEQRTDSI